jgi:hypothetical protein
MEVQLKDLREEDYTDLPEPPAPPGGRLTSKISDLYLAGFVLLPVDVVAPVFT